MITYEDISEAMASITDFGPPDDFGHNEFMAANGIDMDVLNEVAQEGYIALQFFGSTGDELAEELFRGGFLTGFRIAQILAERSIGPEDADKIATGRGGQA
jgi:hypothetical protein